MHIIPAYELTFPYEMRKPRENKTALISAHARGAGSPAWYYAKLDNDLTNLDKPAASS
jgi:hypothetical protein